VDKLKSRASWGVNLAQRQQALDMVARRATQLWKFTRDLRRLRFGDAVKHLNLPRTSSNKLVTHLNDRRKGARASGGLFLEGHFGWEPLVKDIQESIAVFGREFPVLPVKASGKYILPWAWNDGNPTVPKQTNGITLAKWRVQARMKVIDPDVVLLGQMGLDNPLAVAWELVPFSFIVDWFVNVGQCLQNLTDFAGIQLLDPVRGRILQTDEVVRKTKFYTGLGWLPYESWDSSAITIERFPGTIPGPTLKVKPLSKGLTPVRAITAVALLTQQLRNLPPEPARASRKRYTNWSNFQPGHF